MDRLDKTIAASGLYTRRDAKFLLKQRRVRVNGTLVTDADYKVDAESDEIAIDDAPLPLFRTATIMMNKPSGYVTSTDDPVSPTVMALLPEEYKRLELYPVGRLDKDTEGLLLFTNDGDLAHKLISPKHEVEKEYIALTSLPIDEDDILAFQKGITLKDGTKCKSAKLQALDGAMCSVTLKEGKYHQVRRMLASRGKPVIYLKRIREGNVMLGTLESAEVRELDEKEIAALLES